jgi:hypothetical protein
MAYQKLQASRAAAVTPDEDFPIPYVGDPSITWPCVLYTGTGGDIKVKTAGGDEVIFFGTAPGSFLPIQVIQVFAVDTAATNIIALW